MAEEKSSAEAIPRDARKWATVVHIIALVGLLGNGIGFLLGPLIVWLLKKEDHPFVDEQGKESVNFQITMFIVMFICLLLSFVFIGIPLLIIGAIVMTILPIIASVKANEGVHYRYPFAIRFIK